MIRKIFILCLSLVTMSGLAQTSVDTKNYNVEDFNKIVTHGGGSLQISYSNTYTVQVSNGHSCAELVNIFVSSKTLHIEIKDSDADACELKIYIGTPALQALEQNGGGNIILKEGFSPKNSFQCKIKGGGTIDVSKLSVDSFYASIEGGGNIVVNVVKELEGVITGGGAIAYYGDPKVKSNVSGGGVIRKK